jgi:hypothetical protein
VMDPTIDGGLVIMWLMIKVSKESKESRSSRVKTDLHFVRTFNAPGGPIFTRDSVTYAV